MHAARLIISNGVSPLYQMNMHEDARHVALTQADQWPRKDRGWKNGKMQRCPSLLRGVHWRPDQLLLTFTLSCLVHSESSTQPSTFQHFLTTNNFFDSSLPHSLAYRHVLTRSGRFFLFTAEMRLTRRISS
jgi:hypothetical protein